MCEVTKIVSEPQIWNSITIAILSALPQEPQLQCYPPCDDTHLDLPSNLFPWSILPPDKLCYLTLHGCYGGSTLAVRNLTSFGLAGDEGFDHMDLYLYSFLPFISNNKSLVSLTLSHCSFPHRKELSWVTPIKLPKLKTLRLTGVEELSGLVSLIEVPALESLFSIRISTREHVSPLDDNPVTHLQVCVGSDDGFHLLYDTPYGNDEFARDWVDLTHNAGASPALVRFEVQGPCYRGDDERFPPFFENAMVLETSAPFVDSYPNFWVDVEDIGPRLATLRLEVVEGMAPGVATLVEEFVERRF